MNTPSQSVQGKKKGRKKSYSIRQSSYIPGERLEIKCYFYMRMLYESILNHIHSRTAQLSVPC